MRWSEALPFLPLRCGLGPLDYRRGVPIRCLAAVVGGLLLAAAFEPVGLAWLMPLAVASFVLVLRDLPPSRAWLPGLLFGVAFIFTVMVWMRAVGTDAWLAMCAAEAAFFVPLGIGTALATRHRAWPVWCAVWFVAIETLRAGWPFSGMPFGRLAYATADTPWATALPWVGMTGVSLLVALTGTTLAWALVRARARPTAALAAAAALVGVTLLPTVLVVEGEDTGRVTVAAVQGDVPGSGTDLVGVHREVTANHVRATVELAADVRAGDVPAPDFVVWPENSTAVDPFTDGEVNAGIVTASDAVGVPLLIGAMADDPADEEQVLNQGIVWRPGLGGGDRYTKWHPVPYGEYIPFRGSVIPDTYGQLRLITRDMARGTRLEPLRIAGVPVADAICFDVAYDDGIAAQVSRGAELITVQTSNAMFVETGQIHQQFEISRLRALEADRWVVVAAINGVSGIVDPEGRVVASAGARTSAVLVEEVGLRRDVTPASRMGVWPGRFLLATVAVHAAYLLATYRRGSKRGAQPAEVRRKVLV